VFYGIPKPVKYSEILGEVLTMLSNYKYPDIENALFDITKEG
jgi:hypothetical protein